MLFKKFILGFVVLIFLLLTDCGLLPSLRQSGFNDLQKHFDLIDADEPKNFHFVVELEKVKVHIISDWEQSNIDVRKGVTGLASSNNEIWVLGKIVKTKNGEKILILNQAVLGHELQHLLNWKKPLVANPDKLEEEGY